MNHYRVIRVRDHSFHMLVGTIHSAPLISDLLTVGVHSRTWVVHDYDTTPNNNSLVRIAMTQADLFYYAPSQILLTYLLFALVLGC